MPTIQTYFLTIQMTENIKKWSKMVSEGGPKIHQKSSKIHPGTFQGSFECICVPLGHQNGAKMAPRTSKVSQNGDPRTLKGNKNQQHPMTNPATKKLYSKQCSLNFNSENPSNPTNPCSQQVNSQLVTRGAGGRGEALRYIYIYDIICILCCIDIIIFI